MATNNIRKSSYKTYWVEFRAIKGIVTKKDEKILHKYDLINKWKNGDRIHEPFASKEAALDYLREKDFSKLGKQYEVRICCDKQFSQAHSECGVTYITFTKQQEEEMFIIG